MKLKGQMPVNDKCHCQKCDRTLVATKFYQYKDGSKALMCKACQTMHLDPFKPETFLWLLEEYDVAYVRQEWNKLRDAAFAKNPKKVSGMSVFGNYLKKMRLSQYRNNTWADSEKLQAEYDQTHGEGPVYRVGTDEEIMLYNDQIATLREQLESGQISQAQYETLMPTQVLNEEEAAKITAEAEAFKEDGAYNLQQEAAFVDARALPDPTEQLTNEDKIYLAMKWGRSYSLAELVTMEQHYTDMENSFDIRDADTKETLIQICKTNLKQNQAIDVGDLDGYMKLVKVSDTLRKSANFTAAQNKKDNGNFVDSIGELVAFCEAEGHFIPRFVTDIPQDKVDLTLKDMNNYVYNLVTKDLGFGQQIETYLKKIELEKEMEESLDELGEEDEEVSDVEKVAEYYEKLDKEQESDSQLTPEDDAYSLYDGMEE